MAERADGLPKALPVAQIDLGERLRPVCAASVEALAASVAEVGLLHPVLVRPLKAGGWRLICGGHRLAAHVALGRETIMAVERRCGEAEARLVECEENLASAELAALDLALHLEERRRRHLEVNPQAARGVAGAAAKWSEDNGNMQLQRVALASALAEKRGIKPRMVFAYMKLGASLTPEVVASLRARPTPPSYREIARVTSSKAPAAAAANWARGELTLDAAIAEAEGRKVPLKAEETDGAAYAALGRAWDKAGMRDRRKFLARLAVHHAQLLRDALGAEG